MGASAFQLCKKRIHFSSQRTNEKYIDKTTSKKSEKNESQQTISTQDQIQQQKVDDEKIYIKNLENDLLLSIKLKESQIFYSQATSAVTSQITKRLMQEINILRKNLPLYKSNSIFLRYDDGKINLMQALIIGAEGTPYANGMFLFDIYFGSDYPLSPPKMQIMTTGQGQLRFNPNLYSCGKICLSLLGTWSGSKEEKWDHTKSNLLQILLSIQSLVMSEGVYYNEPGHSADRLTQDGKKYNQAYSNIVKFGTIKYAIKEQLRNPSHGFEDVVKKHIFYKKQDILKQCEEWLKQAQKDDSYLYYNGLVANHNSKLAAEFSKEKLSYYNALKLEVEELTKEINQLRI